LFQQTSEKWVLPDFRASYVLFYRQNPQKRNRRKGGEQKSMITYASVALRACGVGFLVFLFPPLPSFSAQSRGHK
jgi:hypothetical protein